MTDKSTIAELARQAQVEDRIIVRFLNQGETIDSIKLKLRLDRPQPLALDDMDLAACHALWLSVLHQAYLDMGKDRGEWNDWLMGDCFPTIATLAGLDPEWARKRLINRAWTSYHRNRVCIDPRGHYNERK